MEGDTSANEGLQTTKLAPKIAEKSASGWPGAAFPASKVILRSLNTTCRGDMTDSKRINPEASSNRNRPIWNETFLLRDARDPDDWSRTHSLAAKASAVIHLLAKLTDR
jgi:hypothetical protein